MKLTEKQLSLIITVLEKHNVTLAYVFGSYVRGAVSPLSDFDIAVFFGKGVPEGEHFDCELKLAREIGSIVKRDRVDVVNLQTVKSPLLKHRAVFYGEPILVGDARLRFSLERSVRQEYEDTKHLRAVQYMYLKKGLGIVV
jgi:uncharacterized protein